MGVRTYYLEAVHCIKSMTVQAKSDSGVFRPLQDVPSNEGTLVEVYVPVQTPARRPRSIAEDMADSVRVHKSPSASTSQLTSAALKKHRCGS